MPQSGPQSARGNDYRNGAGIASQEDRSLWGLNLIWAIMRVPCQRWPGHHRRLPIVAGPSLAKQSLPPHVGCHTALAAHGPAVSSTERPNTGRIAPAVSWSTAWMPPASCDAICSRGSL